MPPSQNPSRRVSSSSSSSAENIEVETLEEEPDDERKPTNNFGPGEAGERILAEMERNDGDDSIPPDGDNSIPPDGDDSGPPDLVDVDGEDDLRDADDPGYDPPPVLKPNLNGCVFKGENLKKFEALCEKYDSIFSKSEKDLGLTKLLYHSIELKTDRPIYTPNYKTPPPEIQKAVEYETNKLLASGCIEESTSPYSSPIVLVRKKNGGYNE